MSIICAVMVIENDTHVFTHFIFTQIDYSISTIQINLENIDNEAIDERTQGNSCIFKHTA